MNTGYIDVFNGDADGLCSLVQIRLANPQESQLITGVKRDIQLLKKVDPQKGDHLTVLDISHEKNAGDLCRLLDFGVTVDYIDHHRTGELYKHPNIRYDINLSSEVCTSLIVDKKLNGQYQEWAITGAFGDNLDVVARRLGEQSHIGETNLGKLQCLGILLNYNAYGSTIDDLFFDPASLFVKLVPHESPLTFLQNDMETFEILESGYNDDISKAIEVPLVHETNQIAVILLPNKKWARRVSGVYSNTLANSFPDRAHAVLTEKENGHFLVSIRAPLNRKQGADLLASQFPTGGGRKAAAGINELSNDKLGSFITLMKSQFS